VRSGDDGLYRCLLQRLAFSELRHFSWDLFPANTMAYDMCTSFCPSWLCTYPTPTTNHGAKRHPITLDAFGYGASLSGSLCNTSKMYVRVRLTSHESETAQKALDLMNPCRLRGGRPCACLFQGRHQSDLIDSIN
jgi:hypothetical protein